jgi:hypothetical protein
VARSRRPGTSAAPAGRPAGARNRAGRVEALLAGETLDTSGLSYDFDAHHVGIVGTGPDAGAAVEEWAASRALPDLIVDGPGGAVWGWLGGAEEISGPEVDALAEAGRRIALERGADMRLALGEPAQGLGGWRLTHQQARVALPVAMRGNERTVRYGEVALVASILRDELLATSLRRLYLEPLENGGDRGEELRQTLRAYFAADRSATAAGEAIGVTRQAVARRLRAVEESLGRSLAVCGADLELALRFDALDATPLLAP